jgi:hypothetical protein
MLKMLWYKQEQRLKHIPIDNPVGEAATKQISSRQVAETQRKDFKIFAPWRLCVSLLFSGIAQILAGNVIMQQSRNRREKTDLRLGNKL